jgi:glutathione peroxidase
MTTKQLLLKTVYPFFAFINKKFKMNTRVDASTVKAATSIYDLEMQQNNGTVFSMGSLKNKKILLVNTASDCGYTAQYDGLQQLSETFKDKLVILGFPSNDLGEQEKADDKTIQEFCKINFGVTFPLMAKSSVRKGPSQNEIFAWLSDKNKNGWNDTAPTWNFCKYLIDENGNLTHFFEAAIEPTDERLIDAVEKSAA